MIQELKGTPNTMVGFVAAHDVTKEDFDNIVLPLMDELVKRTDKLNYLFVLETPLKNFNIGKWMTDAMLRLNNINKWNRSAIVSHVQGVNPFTESNRVMHGEFREFTHDELTEAIRWVGEQDGNSPTQVFQEEGDSKD